MVTIYTCIAHLCWVTGILTLAISRSRVPSIDSVHDISIIQVSSEEWTPYGITSPSNAWDQPSSATTSAPLGDRDSLCFKDAVLGKPKPNSCASVLKVNRQIKPPLNRQKAPKYSSQTNFSVGPEIFSLSDLYHMHLCNHYTQFLIYKTRGNNHPYRGAVRIIKNILHSARHTHLTSLQCKEDDFSALHVTNSRLT